MKILHTYCLNYNLADYALGIGVKNLLREHLDVDLIGNTNLQGREFNEYYINEVVNRKYDLLVIGGGGVIHGAHWPNGWFWLIEKDLIKKIKIPFIVYGVGYNYWEEEGRISQKTIEHLNETVKYAKHFSVRNDGSAARLKEQTGISATVVPDPGFHINLNTEYNRPIEKKYIIIQLANDKANFRFGDNVNQKIFIKQMRRLVLELSKDFLVVFAPHVYDDIKLSHAISNEIPNTSVWDFGYFAFDHVEQAIAYYKYAEFVISMMGHGQIIPIAFNTPVLSLENHPKHRGLMNELGLSNFNIGLNEEYLFQRITNAVQDINKDKKK